MPLSRKAAAALGGVSIYLQPKLANDVALEPLFAGVTDISSPGLLSKIQKAVSGNLVDGAKIDGLKNVLLALDEMDPEEAEDEESEEEREEREKKEKEKKAEDRRKARDSRRTARDAANEGLKSYLKDKMKAEDWKAACDEIDKKEKEDREAEDAEEEDDRPDPERTNDSRPRGRRAHDSRSEPMKSEDVKKAMDSAISGERQRQQAIREAERAVRPWVGDLAIAFDSAEDVYRHALKTSGNKSAADIKELAALKALLELTPKPGAARQNNTPVAMDSAASDSFAKMFPDAMKVAV
jgi:hypothetical protein